MSICMLRTGADPLACRSNGLLRLEGRTVPGNFCVDQTSFPNSRSLVSLFSALYFTCISSKPAGSSRCRVCGEEVHQCSNKGGGNVSRSLAGGHLKRLSNKTCSRLSLQDLWPRRPFSRDCSDKPACGNAYRSCGEGHLGQDCPSKEEGELNVDRTVNYTSVGFEEGEDLFKERNATHCGTGINFNQYDAIPVRATGENVPEAIATFEQLELHQEYWSWPIFKCGDTKPIPIQS